MPVHLEPVQRIGSGGKGVALGLKVRERGCALCVELRPSREHPARGSGGNRGFVLAVEFDNGIVHDLKRGGLCGLRNFRQGAGNPLVEDREADFRVAIADKRVVRLFGKFAGRCGPKCADRFVGDQVKLALTSLAARFKFNGEGEQAVALVGRFLDEFRAGGGRLGGSDKF